MEPLIYVMFSATPYKMGKAIRKVLGCAYNHVSISFVPELTPSFSFARRYRDTPFYGGFVAEGPERFSYGGQCSQVLVCALPVTPAQLAAAVATVDAFRHDPARGLYNLFSAGLAPLGRIAPIPDAYTCVEFAVAVLAAAGQPLEPGRFYSLSQLMQFCLPHCIYRGPYCGKSGDAPVDPRFLQTHGMLYAGSSTARLLWTLQRRRTAAGRQKNDGSQRKSSKNC